MDFISNIMQDKSIIVYLLVILFVSFAYFSCKKEYLKVEQRISKSSDGPNKSEIYIEYEGSEGDIVKIKDTKKNKILKCASVETEAERETETQTETESAIDYDIGNHNIESEELYENILENSLGSNTEGRLNFQQHMEVLENVESGFKFKFPDQKIKVKALSETRL